LIRFQVMSAVPPPEADLTRYLSWSPAMAKGWISRVLF